MARLPGFRREFRFPWRTRTQIASDIDAELEFHLEMRTRELIGRGLTPKAARREAERQFGDVSGTKRYCRTVDGAAEQTRQRRMLLDALRQDAGYAVRSLVGQPGFAAVALLTLAVGIGASTAIFSVVNGVLLRPLPYAAPDRIVQIWETNPDWFESDNPIRRMLANRLGFAYPVYEVWREHAGAFDALAVYSGTMGVFAERDRSEHVVGAVTSASLFDVLGVPARVGRTFLPQEDALGAEPVAVLSYGFWQTRYGGDDAVLGERLRFGDTAYTIVGVMPEGFYFPEPAQQFWVTLNDEEKQGGWRRSYLDGIGRLRDGVSVAEAQADMERVTQLVVAADPDDDDPRGARVLLRLDEVVGGTRQTLLLLLGTVGLVLLVASANVGSLLVVQATARRREIAIRAALGAARGRVVRQLLTESVLLAVIGGGLGFLVATWTPGPLRLLLPPDLPRLDSIAIDPTVLGFAVFASIAVAALFGLGPSIGASRRSITSVLQAGSTATVGGLGTNLGRSVMVVAEVAVSVVLLVGAALLLTSYARLQAVDRGFDEERVLVFGVEAPAEPEIDPAERMTTFFEPALDRLRALPGVDAAALATAPPFRGTDQASFYVEGREGRENQLRGLKQRVTRDYFAAMGIRLLRGRLFDERDTAGTPLVKVINETMAAAFWPGEDPIGQRIFEGSSREPQTIVGVVSDARYVGLDDVVQPFRYAPLAQDPELTRGQVLLRTGGDPLGLVAAARAAVWEIDGQAAVSEFASVAQLVDRSVATPRFRTLLLTLLAFVAVGLTIVGVYGVISYAVARSTRDIALRMALGADHGDVVWQVCRLGGRLIATGVAVGLAAALAATRVLESYLFEVRATDPAIFAAAASLVTLAAGAAILVPASRAARVDPIVALRAE